MMGWDEEGGMARGFSVGAWMEERRVCVDGQWRHGWRRKERDGRHEDNKEDIVRRCKAE